jgi:undecaprenyl-diphosphatase|tara:strand:+ start:17100 stop:17681 length:582 start_codon:yes stop_codon:yes gene_type:complete
LLDPLLQIDTELLIFLNNLGSEQWDSFWFFLTNQFSWSPLFAFLLFLIFKKFGWKNGVLLLLFLIVLITFSDQFTNLIKNTFERLRPCNTEGVIEQIRNFNYKPSSYSFYSGHAASSMTFSFFVILLLKSHFKYIWVLLLFPLLFGYSRIYLGVHYPLDIVSGYFAGIFFGYLFFLLQKKLKLTSRFLKKASI